jgi:hypothetical protein
VAIFGRSRIENPRLYRRQDKSNFAQSCRSTAFHFLVVAVATVLNLLGSAAANADILDENALKSKHGSAVVRIENAQGVVRGYGVVISPQGHVLTAAHVIQGLTPDGIRGQLWPWQNPNPDAPKLTFIDGNADKNVDIALLQIQDSSVRIRPETIPKLIAGSDLTQGIMRILTGTPGLADSLVSLDAQLTVNTNNILETRGSINSGVSGSPVFDRSGNLVGVVVQGLPGETTGYIRPAAVIKDWLKGKRVSVDVAPSAPVIINIYFWIPPYASSAITDVKTNVIAPLTAALSNSLKDQLTPAPEVVTDSKSLEKWSLVANALFNDEALPRERRLDKANQQLSDLEYQAWLRKMAFSQLYLLIVRVEKEEGLLFANLRPVLLVITQQGDRLDLEYVEDPKAKFKIYPPPDFKPAITNEPFRSMQDSLAVELIHIIVRKRPDFARNNRVFADCIRFPGLDYTKNDRLYYAPNNLEAQLTSVFKANQKQVKVRSASEKACREAVSRNIPRYLWPDHLNEYIVDASISGKAVHWQAGHPWDDEEDRPKEETRSDGDPEGSDDFEPTVKALATDIDRKWSQILNKINGATR